MISVRESPPVLIRLRVDGFKNLRGLSVDFGPFTCIVGPNAAGKSNVVDPIQFLAALADRPIMEAAQSVRALSRPADLLWTDGSRTAKRMAFELETIVPSEVTDDFGRRESAMSTFLRYDLVLG